MKYYANSILKSDIEAHTPLYSCFSKSRTLKSFHEFEIIPSSEFEEIKAKIARYERYLLCSYSHDFQSIQGNAFFCNKCGYSKGELSLKAQAIDKKNTPT